MSNHSGSYMLNSALFAAKKAGIFKLLGKEKSREFALELVTIGNMDDCNPGEILEEIGEELGICYCCSKQSDELEDGLCKKCAVIDCLTEGVGTQLYF